MATKAKANAKNKPAPLTRDSLREALLAMPVGASLTVPESSFEGMPRALVRTLNGGGREAFGTLSHGGTRFILRVA